MRKRRKKRVLLDRTDHRLDMSPAGRNLFVSRDKQEQNQAARRIRIWMRVVLALGIAAAAAAVCMFVLFYLAPWFHSELTVSGGQQGSSSSIEASSAALEYDEMGLPVYDEKVCLFVVNRDSPTWRGFSPELAAVEGVEVDARAASALRLLLSAAKENGFSLSLSEGYVSYEEQERRFEAKVEELMNSKGLTTVMARSEAASLEPEPGESDFQSGMCVRLKEDPETFGESKACSWLRANMGKYGFVFRYPEGKESTTGMGADLTVIRYVGSASASAMQQRSMCLEEYISYLDSQ